MANKDFAFGLRPVRTLGGTANFTANEYTIPSGASNAIYQGSLVIMHADGVQSYECGQPHGTHLWGTYLNIHALGSNPIV